MSPNARAYYAADIAQFASSSVAAILGNLAANTDFDIELAQRNAWSEQIPFSSVTERSNAATEERLSGHAVGGVSIV